MFAKRDVRKSALTILAAALVSTLAGIAASAHASPLAASARLATPSTMSDGKGAEGAAERNAHRLTRPNRLDGRAGTAGTTIEGR
jgi:hypothetical protein